MKIEQHFDKEFGGKYKYIGIGGAESEKIKSFYRQRFKELAERLVGGRYECCEDGEKIDISCQASLQIAIEDSQRRGYNQKRQEIIDILKDENIIN